MQVLKRSERSKKKCEQWRSIFFDEGTGGAI